MRAAPCNNNAAPCTGMQQQCCTMHLQSYKAKSQAQARAPLRGGHLHDLATLQSNLMRAPACSQTPDLEPVTDILDPGFADKHRNPWSADACRACGVRLGHRNRCIDQVRIFGCKTLLCPRLPLFQRFVFVCFPLFLSPKTLLMMQDKQMPNATHTSVL